MKKRIKIVIVLALLTLAIIFLLTASSFASYELNEMFNSNDQMYIIYDFPNVQAGAYPQSTSTYPAFIYAYKSFIYRIVIFSDKSYLAYGLKLNNNSYEEFEKRGTLIYETNLEVYSFEDRSFWVSAYSNGVNYRDSLYIGSPAQGEAYFKTATYQLPAYSYGTQNSLWCYKMEYTSEHRIEPSLTLELFNDEEKTEEIETLNMKNGYLYYGDYRENDVFYLGIKTVNLSSREYSVDLELNPGLSFSPGDPKARTKTVKFSGKGTAENAVPIYGVKDETSKTKVSFDASGDLSTYLSVPVIELPDDTLNVSLALFSSVTGNQLSELIYTFGSYSWEDENNDDFTSCKMRIDLTKRDADLIESYSVTLPDGFSFSKDTINYTQLIAFSRVAENRLQAEISIYPIYSDSTKTSLKVTVKKDALEGEGTFPITQNSSAGLILMRPTSGVNHAETAPFSLNITYSPAENFTAPSGIYNNTLAILGCTLSQSVYNENYRENLDSSYTYRSFRNLGFTKIVWQGSVDNHDVASGYALKRIIKNGEIINVVLIAIRGTVGTEWIGNFNIKGNDSTVHADFNACNQNTMGRIEAYLNALAISADNTRFFICGHSRAGAVTDLVAHSMNSKYGSDKIYAYTFAAPNSTKNPVEDSNIFNYVYKYDIVGFVPGGGYGKHGQTIVVGGEDVNSAPSAVKSAFSSNTNGTAYTDVGNKFLIRQLLSLDDMENHLINETINELQRVIGFVIAKSKPSKQTAWMAKGHSGENYCAWVMKNGTSGGQTYQYFADNMKSEFARLGQYTAATAATAFCQTVVGKAVTSIGQTLVSIFDLGLRAFSIQCPVNIRILDSDGYEVVSFTGHTATVSDYENTFALGDGNGSYFLVPSDQEYQIIISGTGNGFMNVYCFDLNADLDFMNSAIIEKIPVHQGEVFTLYSSSVTDYSPVLSSSNGSVYDAMYQHSIPLDPMDDFIVPYGTVTISEESFRNIKASRIYIPASVKTIENRAFSACAFLTAISFESGDVDAAADFLEGCTNTLEIIAPTGSKIKQNESLFREYLCEPAPIILPEDYLP